MNGVHDSVQSVAEDAHTGQCRRVQGVRVSLIRNPPRPFLSVEGASA